MLDSAGYSGGGFIESRPEEGFVDPAFRSFGMFNFNPVAFGGYLGQHHAAFDIGDDGGTCGRFGPHIDGLLGIDDDRISGSDHSLVDPAGSPLFFQQPSEGNPERAPWLFDHLLMGLYEHWHHLSGH